MALVVVVGTKVREHNAKELLGKLLPGWAHDIAYSRNNLGRIEEGL